MGNYRIVDKVDTKLNLKFWLNCLNKNIGWFVDDKIANTRCRWQESWERCMLFT